MGRIELGVLGLLLALPACGGNAGDQHASVEAKGAPHGLSDGAGMPLDRSMAAESNPLESAPSAEGGADGGVTESATATGGATDGRAENASDGGAADGLTQDVSAAGSGDEGALAARSSSGGSSNGGSSNGGPAAEDSSAGGTAAATSSDAGAFGAGSSTGGTAGAASSAGGGAAAGAGTGEWGAFAGGTAAGGMAAGGTAAGGTAAGGTAAGGTSGSGASGGGTAGAASAPPHTVGACDKLGSPGVLENVTPAGLHFENWCTPGSDACKAPGAISTYGAHSLAADPNNSGTLYLGTDGLGFWKTTDCGSTWVKIDTGAHQKEIDSGRNWTIVIDPTDSNVIYTTPGYGDEGLYKSVNGGVDWQQMFTADVLPSLQYGGFIETIAIDPTNHRHLVVSFHIDCKNGPNGADWACLAETPDAGATWKLVPSAQHWSEGDGQTLIDAQTWFFGNGADGIWRTTNAGARWDKVYNGKASGHVFTGADGKFYVAGQPMVQSADGVTWTPLLGAPDGSSVNGSNPIASDGKRLFSAGGQYGGSEPASGWFASAPLSDPSNWTPVFQPVTMSNGGSTIVYDTDHKVLYSASLISGVWRGRIE